MLDLKMLVSSLILISTLQIVAWSVKVHETPQGIPVAPFFLQFSDPHHLAEASCDSVEFDDVIPTLGWTLSPYIMLSSEVKERVKKLKTLTPQQMNYKNTYDQEQLPPREFLVDCIAHQILTKEYGIFKGFCVCIKALRHNDYCETLDSLYKWPTCLDKVAKKIDPSTYCPYLKKILVDPALMPLSEKCSGIVTGSIELSDLYLFPLHRTAHIAKTIDPTIVRQELRTYYLALYALERYVAWVDSILFCKSAGEFFKSDELEDIKDVLYGWKPIMHFKKLDLEFKELPIALLNERVNSVNAHMNAFHNKSYLLIIRAPRTTEEAVLSLSHRTEDNVHNEITGLTHSGYQVLANALLTEIEIFLPKVFKAVTPMTSMQFTIIGEGHLGGGAAAILATILSKKFPVIPINNAAIEYNVIAFDAGSAGDSEFNSHLQSHVNFRNIISKRYGVYVEPCSTMRRCEKDFAEVEIMSLETLPGRVEFEIEHSDQLQSFWNSYESISSIEAQTFYYATSCWLKSITCKESLQACNVDSIFSPRNKECSTENCT